MTFTDESPYAIFTEHFSLFSLYSLKKFCISVMISLCFMHNRKKIRTIMIGLKIREKYFLA